MTRTTPPAHDNLIGRVRQHMKALGLNGKAAATLIGVGTSTLQDHLAGEHIRSDSARKYEDWLAGRGSPSNVFALPVAECQAELELDDDVPPVAPARPRLVVDIFSGCGGLSLGFDLLDGGKHFRTVLALDSQAAPIATFNRNAALLGHGDQGAGRVVDLTEFLNGCEFLAFYLQHAADTLADDRLRDELHALCGGRFPLFLDAISSLDRRFIENLNAIRSGTDWRVACARLDRRAMNQTSVLAFHDRLRLPRPSSKVASLPPLLWGAAASERAPKTRARQSKAAPDAGWLTEAELEWDVEAGAIVDGERTPGRGQLSSSSRRLASFGEFLNEPAMQEVRDAWAVWRACRLDLRSELFCDQGFADGLRRLYAAGAPVSVLVGGPPCQGFSRIGRGKIRSLRDARVHAHPDDDAGDARNNLFKQYVNVLGALRPDVFLFENVAHFKSVVKVGEQAFLATDLLADAIKSISDDEVSYDIASDTLDASRHGIPQNRLRYFMAGLRQDGHPRSALGPAGAMLALRRAPEAPLSLALAGLPFPAVVGGDLKAKAAMSGRHQLSPEEYATHPFTAWVRQVPPGGDHSPPSVDAHACRAPRSDDAAFFALMGPGRRWMDYRADGSDTLTAIRETLAAVLALPDEALEKARAASPIDTAPLPSRSALLLLYERLDGSLPLRLLLEQIGTRLGSPHHLLGSNYLEKREGNHGDWVARMDATRPAKTMTSHMGKDTYAYVHPFAPRTISVREAARIQSFPDWFSFGDAALTDAYKMIGNAVPPMLSHVIASRVAQALHQRETNATVHQIRA